MRWRSWLAAWSVVQIPTAVSMETSLVPGTSFMKIVGNASPMGSGIDVFDRESKTQPDSGTTSPAPHSGFGNEVAPEMTCENCNRPVCAKRFDETCQAFGALYRLWMHFQLVTRVDAVVEAECILELAGSISSK